MEFLALAGALGLAFVNGANDNFKGVATLYGSGALDFEQARWLATLSTAAGSFLSLALASGLVLAFSGKGIVPPEWLDAKLLAAVAGSATITVMLATRMGFPVSTTHALVGGLAGAGYVAAGDALALGALAKAFLLPLLVGPLLAVALTWGGLVGWRSFRSGSPADSDADGGSQLCICIGIREAAGTRACPAHPGLRWAPQPQGLSQMAATATREIAIEVGNAPECEQTFSGPIAAIHTSQVMQWGHLASATAVGFARGLNDTPKILGLTVSLSIVTPLQGTLAIGIMMALGGWLAARRVANTLAKKITPMSEQQGLLGNFVTALLVIGASRLNLPVSTTHVSGGAIFGIGASKASLDLPMVKQILAAWLTTLPIAALLGALLMGSQWL